jgi:hypothetical protein
MQKKEEKKSTKKQVLFKKLQTSENPHLLALNSLIRSNRKGKEKNVSFTYTKPDGSISQRTVRPIQAKKHLLVAHDHTRDALRTFHIERISNMEKNAFFVGFEKKASLNKLASFASHATAAGIGALGAAGGIGYLGYRHGERSRLEGEERARKDLLLGLQARQAAEQQMERVP